MEEKWTKALKIIKEDLNRRFTSSFGDHYRVPLISKTQIKFVTVTLKVVVSSLILVPGSVRFLTR